MTGRQASIERAREVEDFIHFSPWRDEVPDVPASPPGEWGTIAWARYAASLAAALADAERQRDEALAGLWNAYVLTGSDPDGADRWHCPLTDAVRYTLAAIDELSGNYDQACDEAVAAEAALADTQARNQELLDAIEAFADATAVAAGNILRPPRED